MYKLILLLLVCSISQLTYSDVIQCIPTKTKDVCIRTPANYDDSHLLDPFSSEQFDSFLSYGGVALWDGGISGLNGLGSQLAINASVALAKELGVPENVLALIGFGSEPPPDISNMEVVRQINESIGRQTHELIIAMEDLQHRGVLDVQRLLASNCRISWEEDYSGILQGLKNWSSYDANFKYRPEQLNSVLRYLERLSESRIEYGTINNGYCFWAAHVEYFPWLMRLLSLEQSIRSQYHTIVAHNTNTSMSNLAVDLSTNQNDISNIIYNLENTYSTYTNSILAEDEYIPEGSDQDNAWWYDVVNDTTTTKEVWDVRTPGGNHIGDAPEYTWQGCETVANGSTFFDEEIITSNSGLLKELKSGLNNAIWEQTLSLFDTRRIKRCPLLEYSIAGLKNEIVLYVMQAVNISSPIVRESVSVVVSENFVRESLIKDTPLNYDYAEKIIGDLRYSDVNQNNWESIMSKARAWRQENMELVYTQRLQMAYAPYQDYLDTIWNNVGKERQTNKFDRELDRWSGLTRLDSDGLSITEELQLGTNPRSNDTDGDGLNDGWEINYGLDPLIPTDIFLDRDSDGLNEEEEYRAGTNPRLVDTDGDTLSDYWEVKYGPDPLVHNSLSADRDGDGLTEAEEYQLGTNPKSSDTDADGLPDGWELKYELDPLIHSDLTADRDGDGRHEADEFFMGTNPLVADDLTSLPNIYSIQGVYIAEDDVFAVSIFTNASSCYISAFPDTEYIEIEINVPLNRDNATISAAASPFLDYTAVKCTNSAGSIIEYIDLEEFYSWEDL
jgi:hypothetical protein